MTFGSDLKKFKEKTLKNANEFKQGVGVELFNSVIMDTPVDEGRARGNWQTTINKQASGEVGRSPAEAIKEASTPSNFGDLSDTNYLTNNLPYIQELENGSSTQAPQGMVRKNIARIERILKEQARKIKS